MMTFLICLKPTFLAWMIFTYVVFCFIFVGECIGVIFCSLFAHVGLAVNIMSLVLSFFGEIVSLLLACSVYLFYLFFSYCRDYYWFYFNKHAFLVCFYRISISSQLGFLCNCKRCF
jgi:hypothetical protein